MLGDGTRQITRSRQSVPVALYTFRGNATFIHRDFLPRFMKGGNFNEVNYIEKNESFAASLTPGYVRHHSFGRCPVERKSAQSRSASGIPSQTSSTAGWNTLGPFESLEGPFPFGYWASDCRYRITHRPGPNVSQREHVPFGCATRKRLVQSQGTVLAQLTCILGIHEVNSFDHGTCKKNTCVVRLEAEAVTAPGFLFTVFLREQRSCFAPEKSPARRTCYSRGHNECR